MKKVKLLPPEMRYSPKACVQCGKTFYAHAVSKDCDNCGSARHAFRFWNKSPLQYESAKAVAKAKRDGVLPYLPDGTICSNCKESPATQYDHRDYSKPLDVTPVCRSCNINLGSAKGAFKFPYPLISTYRRDHPAHVYMWKSIHHAPAEVVADFREQVVKRLIKNRSTTQGEVR